jgi:hypothetical protein
MAFSSAAIAMDFSRSYTKARHRTSRIAFEHHVILSFYVLINIFISRYIEK